MTVFLYQTNLLDLQLFGKLVFPQTIHSKQQDNQQHHAHCQQSRNNQLPITLRKGRGMIYNLHVLRNQGQIQSECVHGLLINHRNIRTVLNDIKFRRILSIDNL